MVLKKGRYGEFLACSGYPDCKNTQQVGVTNQEVKSPEGKPEECPQCGSQLVQKHGRFGAFVACSNYPECKYIKQELTDVTCPECGGGKMVRRKTRRGKVFYGCSTFPECQFALWQKPVDRKCPSCGASYLLERTTKKEGLTHNCNQPECDFKEIVEAAEASTG